MRAWLLLALGAAACFSNGETLVGVAMDSGDESTTSGSAGATSESDGATSSSATSDSTSDDDDDDSESGTGDSEGESDDGTGEGPDESTGDGGPSGCDGSTNDGCAPGCQGETYDGHAYAICSSPTTWVGARETCASMGYDLAVITDADENAFVAERLVALTGDGLGSWIGANDLETEGQWVWLDGTETFWEGESNGLATGFAVWGVGEPNEDFAGEDCGSLVAGFQAWNDLGCTQPQSYACEQL